jgi:hypothetical protein
MTLDDLTAALDGMGVNLSLRLVVDAPTGALTSEIKAALKAHKPTLVARLASVEVSSKTERDISPPCKPPYPWRAGLLEWPTPWREAWGRRSNQLEQEEGMCWWRAEKQARTEVADLRRRMPSNPDPSKTLMGTLGRMTIGPANHESQARRPGRPD